MAGSTSNISQLKKAATAIKNAKALIITAGAGMGVDSGLPDFRGPEGFWKAYPPLKDKGIELAEMSNPQWFHNDPQFAWGFFGHRHNLYTKAEPHKGFQILKRWAFAKENGYFVYTSNVDGHFQRAGFSEENVVECHGSINFMQCVDPDSFSRDIWPTPKDQIKEIDVSTLRMSHPLPQGPPGADEQVLARPNILMFGNWEFVGTRTSAQEGRYEQFQESLKEVNFAVIEIGAGTSVPTIRYQSQDITENFKEATLIRINPMEPEVPEEISHKSICLPKKGLEALEAIDQLIKKPSS